MDRAEIIARALHIVRRQAKADGGIVYDEYGQPHDSETGEKLSIPDRPTPSLEQSLKNIAWSPVELAKGAITAPYEAAAYLFGTPGRPGHLWEGPGTPGFENNQNAESMRTLLETFLGGNATRGMEAVERGAGHPNTLAAPTVNIYDPPTMPMRPFEADYPPERYPNGPPIDEQGRLTHDIDGRPLNPNAPFIVGRRNLGGLEKAINPGDYDALRAYLTTQDLGEIEPGTARSGPAGHLLASRATGKPARIELRSDLSDDDRPRVYAHEIAHAIDRTAVPFAGVPQDAAYSPALDAKLRHQFGQIYNDLNNPDEAMRGVTLPRDLQFNPDDLNYPSDQWAQEYGAEALRAYMANPNYMKSVAPDVARRLRAYINPHPELSKIIQFNSNQMPSVWSSAMAGDQDEGKPLWHQALNRINARASN